METQALYQEAIKFAAAKHKEQTVPGTDMSYVVHLSNVAMEILQAAPHSSPFNTGFAVQLALLHDTLEDTITTVDELTQKFGKDVALGVAALTKNDSLAKVDKMMDSLSRIKQQVKEVWAVKLADRITNLQKPPVHWNNNKIAAYQTEARIILSELKGGNQYLENRLREKIAEYGIYVSE
jgi:(p)ppGpp synthase/HD superfamily hydrolase